VGGQSSAGGVTVSYGAPTIVGVNPVSVSGKGGTPVVISGLNFGATPGQVSFGGVPATPTAWSHTAIQVTSPLIPSGEEAALVITQAGQSSPAFALTVARSLDDPISQTLDETGTPELVFDFGDIELEIQFEGVTGSGTVTVNAVPGNAAPAGKNPANFITMRWEISATPGLTFTYATLVFTFGDDVLNGMNRSELFVVFRDSGGNLTRYTGVVNLAERTVTVTGVTGFSTWYISDEDTTSVSDWSLLD
jgi:hypothetical protein